MVIHYQYSFPTTSFEDTVLATPGRLLPSLTVPFISYRFGSFRSRAHRNRYHCVIVSAGKPSIPFSGCFCYKNFFNMGQIFEFLVKVPLKIQCSTRISGQNICGRKKFAPLYFFLGFALHSTFYRNFLLTILFFGIFCRPHTRSFFGDFFFEKQTHDFLMGFFF